ncbi:MAG TPA: MdtA/MuxA family multidrug efflux RND transporter periplasmic adaptor subunit [Xanthobacteraceae bacterium]|nr:MdtA/MuxA family multidrug efflux RND transporter periplasmic adaptor subunit [Xanthobacteraceae bacterium]
MDERTKKLLNEKWPEQFERVSKRVAAGLQTRTRVAAVIGGLFIVALLAWWWLGPSRAPVATRTPPPIPVSVATVQTGDIDVTLNALGTVTSLATVTIRSQINGQIMRIAFDEGQIVKKGDLLAQIDSRPYELARSLAEGALKRDQAMLHDSQLDLERYKKLAETKAISSQQVDAQIALVAQNQGNVISDQAQIDTANLNITYCNITAPVNGRVGLRQVDQGNYVTPSDANGIVVITQLQPISVIFTVAEDNLPAIIKQLNAGNALTTTAFDRSGTTKLATGKLSTIDNQIDTTTGTLKLRANFENEEGNLFPNQFVNIELLVDVLRGVNVAPNSAIQRGAPGTFVYIVNADNTVSVRKVELDKSTAENVAVKSGLAPGDRVVVDGADKLRDGSKVMLRETAQPSAETPSAPTNAGSEKGRSRKKQQ